jgi:hypothetical protein
MFPVTDNPADRLIKILTEAKKTNANHISEAFAKVFGFTHGDKITFYRTFGYLNELLDQVEAKVRQIPDIKHDLYLRDIPAIRSVITPSGVSDSWNQLKQPLEHGALTCLDFCSDLLSKHHQESNIDNAEIDKIKAKLAALYKLVTASDLNPDLKAVIFDLLTTIQLSIDAYKIKGAEGLKRSLVYASGLVKVHKERIRAENHKPAVMEVFEFVNNVAVVVTAAYNMKELALGVGGLLGLGGESKAPME